MPLYTTKSAFLASDMKACPMPPSDPSCPICREDLQPQEPEALSAGPSGEVAQNGATVTASSAEDNDPIAANSAPAEPNEDHSPVKVTCCNNIFGRSCLEAWLTRGNSCPFCRAEFFPSRTVPTEMTFEWFAQLIERAEARTDARLEAARARFTEGMGAAHARFTEDMVARYIQRMEAAASGITGIRRRDLRTLEALQQAGPDVGLPTRDDAEDESELSSEYESEDESDSMPELEPLDEMEGYHSESESVLSEDEDDESEFEDEDEDSGDEDEGGDGPPQGPGSGGAVCVECAHTGASVRA
ncbi:uncharacterized protein J4E87_007989 [Alternaria ethzedia]|uniref:uncharacterized protein n=1 Tax=Alternaria ethzedia TaxID=181014 RepID=UPI0020C4C956|nr:uncharacterized protein J4E87_007989 [Alternaria ethzedia]KAI4618321.1 hypothetical protein J4E87_007989 [Alternaria ethzedia]